MTKTEMLATAVRKIEPLLYPDDAEAFAGYLLYGHPDDNQSPVDSGDQADTDPNWAEKPHTRK